MLRTEKQFVKKFSGMLVEALETFYGYDDYGNPYDAEYWSLDENNNRIHQKYEGTDTSVRGIKYKKDGSSKLIDVQCLPSFLARKSILVLKKVPSNSFY
jgi:hypothetical protein